MRYAALFELRLALVLLACLAAGKPAQALPYTLAAPVDFSGSGLSGTISGTLNPAIDPLATCAGALICDVVNNDVLFFTATLDASSDSVGLLGMVIQNAGNLTTSGSISDGDPATKAPLTQTTIQPNFIAFDFDSFNSSSANLLAGETSDLLVVGYGAGQIADAIAASSSPVARARIWPPGRKSFFSSPSFDPILVPEPSTATLMLLGLTAFARACRRSQTPRHR